MKRRKFLLKAGLTAAGVMACGVSTTAQRVGTPIRWSREGDSRLYSAVACDGEPLVHSPSPGLLDAYCQLRSELPAQATRVCAKQPIAQHGPLHMELSHQLRDSGNGVSDDLLEATLTVRNVSERPQQIELAFATSARPSANTETQRVHLPLTAAGLLNDQRFAAFGVKDFLKESDQPLGASGLAAHYLEPMASFPTERETRALLLAPVVDLYHPQAAWRLAMFTASDQPMRFSMEAKPDWRASRCVTLAPGATYTQRCWLLLHTGNAAMAWDAFHRFAHREEFAVPDWVHEFKVHYFDFLSSATGQNGPRGNGYEADLAHFREFRVGLATQHGYYPAIGDFIHPDRKTWLAMQGDKQGAVEMSLEKMRTRIQATHAAGAKAAIYLHAALLDDAAPCFPKLRDCVQVNAQEQRMKFDWTGPDTAGKTWHASLAAPLWREHLLQQAAWIMDILQPDAIVVDETFAGLSYDHHPDRAGPTSAGAIDFYRQLRSLVRSFGDDKAFFTSDCSMSPFVLWADGECGDHAYSSLLGHPLYTEEPVRYLAPLGKKPWRPCAWHFQGMWSTQMQFARQVGAGVGVSNGWIEYTGLASLPADAKAKMLADITCNFGDIA